jgi:predicted nucleotidyltransferase
MSAPVTTTATSAEKQLFEVAGTLQAREVAAAEADPAFEPRLTVAIDAEGGTVTITATLPATITSDGGVLSFTPQDYLP